MRPLVDENVDRLLVTTLREAGHDIIYVAEDRPRESDTDLFRFAAWQDRGLLTDDLGFGRLTELEAGRPPVVIIMRLSDFDRAARVRRVIEAMTALGESMRNHLVVIEPNRVRKRAFDEF